MSAVGSANKFDSRGYNVFNPSSTYGSGFTPPPLNTSQPKDYSTQGYAGLPVFNFNN